MKKLLIPLVAIVCVGCETTSTTPTASSAVNTAVSNVYAPPSATLGDMRSQALAAHPEWTPEVQQWVKEGRLGPGMTTEAVQAAWGTAAKKTKDTAQGLVKEEWTYSYPKDPNVYQLHFENGKLVTWSQDKK